MRRVDRWQLLQDAVLAGLVCAAGLAEVWAPFESVQGSGSPVTSTVGIVGCGLLLAFRRSAPVVLVGVPAIWIGLGIVAGGDLQVLFFGQLVPLYLALYSAARHGTRREAALVCGSVLAAVLIADLTIPELQSANELLFHWAVLLAVFGVGVGLRTSERRAVEAALRASAAEATAREEALRAVAEERARIARELHDILGHSVSVMVVQAGAAAQAVEDDPAFARRALEAIRTTGTQSLDEVRRVVALLRDDHPAGIAPQPGLAALPELIASACTSRLSVTLTESGEPALGPGQELAVYRIVQEALTNVRKHASASNVHVEITHGAQATEVLVTDDGGTAAAPLSAGHGLVGMQERVALYGGSLTAGAGGDGWQVHATLPTPAPMGAGS